MRILVTILIITFAIGAFAQRTTRPQLQQRPEAMASATLGDTVFDIGDEIVISGYEKTLRSRKESFLTTNNSDRALLGMRVTIDYYDMEGRQLHQRSVDITWPEGSLPIGETRMSVFKSWDPQLVWYYHLSMPTRTKLQATPYDIKAKIDYYIIEPKDTEN